MGGAGTRWSRSGAPAMTGALVLTVLGTLVVGTTSAVAATAPTITSPTTVPTSPDYASETWADPWDYANREDLLTDPGPVGSGTSARLAGGHAIVEQTGAGYISPVWVTYPGSLPTTRPGTRNPIPASRYTHATVRVHATERTFAAWQWFGCHDFRDDCLGGRPFVIEPGWQTITVELANTFPGLPVPWSGNLIGLRLAFNPEESGTTARYRIDWMRLHAEGPTTTVRWEAEGEGRSELIWDADADPSNNTPDAPGWGVVASRSKGGTVTSSFPSGAYPGGTYRFAVRSGGRTSAYSAALRIDQRPLVDILDPDAAGGRSYAEEVLGDAWDMDHPRDVVRVGNARDVRFSGGVLSATNTNNDPYVQLRLAPSGLDPSRYHRLTVTTSYDGPFSLEDAPGGGAHGRVIWWRADSGPWTFLNSRELVTFTDRDRYTVDLATDPPTAVQEPGDRPLLGWTGSPVTYLRYDPNEDPGPRRWRLDHVALRADDETTDGRFDIRWRDAAHEPGTRVTIRADRDRRGHDGAVIGSGIAQEPGENRFRWAARDALPGRYWIAVTADDGTATTSRYATGPLQVDPRLRGPDRVRTAVALSRNAFPEGADVAVLAAAGSFPDALAAVPLAGAAAAPVLLNPGDRLDADVARELARLGVDEVVIAGGVAAQSSAVADALRSRGYTVRRIAGRDRYATASALARAAVQRWRAQGDAGAGRDVLVALGTDFADALAAGSLATAAHRPLLLVQPDAVPSATAEALDRLGAERVTIVGGERAIRPAVAAALGRGGRHVTRLAGASRYGTAAAVATAAVEAGADPGTILVATGEGFADALAAAPAVAARGGVLLLTARTSLPPETAERLRAVRDRLRWLRVAGGPAAVTDTTVARVLAAAGIPR